MRRRSGSSPSYPVGGKPSPCRQPLNPRRERFCGAGTTPSRSAKWGGERGGAGRTRDHERAQRRFTSGRRPVRASGRGRRSAACREQRATGTNSESAVPVQYRSQNQATACDRHLRWAGRCLRAGGGARSPCWWRTRCSGRTVAVGRRLVTRSVWPMSAVAGMNAIGRARDVGQLRQRGSVATGTRDGRVALPAAVVGAEHAALDRNADERGRRLVDRDGRVGRTARRCEDRHTNSED